MGIEAHIGIFLGVMALSFIMSLVVGAFIYRLGMREGFDRGRMTQNQPTVMEIKRLDEGHGVPVAEYDPYEDAMNDDETIDTLKK